MDVTAPAGCALLHIGNHRTCHNRPKMANLTSRERAVLKLISDGHTSKQIVHELGIAFRTVVAYRARIRQKLGIATTEELQSAPSEWRDRLNDAYQRLTEARLHCRQVQLTSGDFPSPDGSFAYRLALRDENFALAEYRRILRIYTDLILGGAG